MAIRAPTARTRSFAKALTWRLVGGLDTFVISYIVAIFFHQHMRAAAGIAGSIAVVETFTKVTLFYLHERAWDSVPWGRADRVVGPGAGPAAGA